MVAIEAKEQERPPTQYTYYPPNYFERWNALFVAGGGTSTDADREVLESEAQQHLTLLYEPALLVPPEDEHTIVTLPGSAGVITVPFVEREVDAIFRGTLARERLRQLSGLRSGAARDYTTEVGLFPNPVSISPLISLTDRVRSVRAIYRSAQVAEGVLVNYDDEFRSHQRHKIENPTREELLVLYELPYKLIPPLRTPLISRELK